MKMDVQEGTKVSVVQVRSGCGRGQRVQDTLRALGLGKIGRRRKHVINPALWGMLRRLSNIVIVHKRDN